MFTLDQPLTKAQISPEVESLSSSSERKPNFTLRTIKRDLKLLTERHLYYAEIEISGGANRVTTVDVEDFSLPAAVLQVWKTTRSRKKAPQVMVFEELADAVKQLNEQRRLIYKDHTVSLQIYRTIPGSHLEGFMSAFTELQAQSDRLLSNVLESHTEAKTRFLRDEIRPLLTAGYFSDEETQHKLALYANRFPKLEQIQIRFGVQMKGPFQMQTWREALEEDAAAQQLLAERDRLSADIAQSRAEAVAADQETWLVEQERRAYQSAHAYQQQQIRSAIESKVSEVQHQVLNLLYRNLKKLSDKDYQPGKIPPGLKRQLEELAESASILSGTDQSLAQVVEGLTQVNATASVPQAAQDILRVQVDALLSQLESRLRVPELEVIESLGNDDRAAWLKWA
jgi:biopolymer transport protein ExbB/TolQ